MVIVTLETDEFSYIHFFSFFVGCVDRVKTECQYTFSIKYGHHPGADKLYTVDGVQLVCARMVAIFYTKSILSFSFYPCLILRLITDTDLGVINLIFGHKLVDIWATELCTRKS